MSLFDFGEFMDFFIDVLFGDVKKICSSAGIQVENKVDTDNLVSSVSSSIRKHSSKIKQDVFSNQDIEITCGGKDINVNPNLLTYRKHEKNILGMDKEGTGCVVRGCCPEISQIAKIQLAAINKNAIKESREMVNKITEKISADTSVNVDGCGFPTPTKVNSKVLSETSDQTYEKVRELIKKEVDFKYDGSQKVRIHFRRPMVCVNNCDEPPRSQSITQEANIEALARNIVDVISEDIDKKTIETEITTSVSVDSSDTMQHMKGVIYSIVTCIVLVIIYILFYILQIIIVWLIKSKVPHFKLPPPAKHAFTMLIIFITYKIWGLIRCTIQTGSFLTCVGIWHFLECGLKAMVRWVVCLIPFVPCPKCSEACCPEQIHRCCWGITSCVDKDRIVGPKVVFENGCNTKAKCHQWGWRRDPHRIGVLVGSVATGAWITAGAAVAAQASTGRVGQTLGHRDCSTSNVRYGRGMWCSGEGKKGDDECSATR